MAFSDNLASIDSWAFRSTFADSWFTDAFSRETETLTKVLQKSLSDSLSPAPTSPFMDLTKPDNASPTATTVSGLSGSDHEPAPKRSRSSIPPAAGGKAPKRKSRASKRSQTTYITADPANFRQMVQQVTGVRLGNSHMQMAPILKPEPQRLGGRIPAAGGGCLPTLDTSAFLLDQQQQQEVVGPAQAATVSGGPGFSGPGPLLPFSPSVGMVDGAAGLDFDSFAAGFPTLESWKVM